MDSEVQDFETHLDIVFARAREILLAKRAMRGRDNILNQGMLGLVNRVKEDKLSRILNYAILVYRKYNGENTPEVNDAIEAHEISDIEDDMLDALNYCAIMVLLYNGNW